MLDTISSADTTANTAAPSLEVYDLAIAIATELLTGFYLNLDVRYQSAWVEFGVIVNTIARRIQNADPDLLNALARERDASE